MKYRQIINVRIKRKKTEPDEAKSFSSLVQSRGFHLKIKQKHHAAMYRKVQ